jgi:glutathione S-transferase
MSALPLLYSFRRCPYAMRARLALAASGEAYELREVLLRDKPAELLAASPKGTVPVLVLRDGTVIDQSLDIMRWALTRHDPEGWLASDLTSMLELIAGNDGLFKHSLDRYKYPNRYPEESAGDIPGFALDQRALAVRWLAALEPRLAAGWLFGASASLADFALLPFVRQFAHTDPAWFALQPWSRLAGWLTRFETSERYAAVMGKHQRWVGPAP